MKKEVNLFNAIYIYETKIIQFYPKGPKLRHGHKLQLALYDTIKAIICKICVQNLFSVDLC